MNKMSEVFKLPVKGVSEWSDFDAATFCYFVSGGYDLTDDVHMKAAAHAINSHDALTERVKVLEAALTKVANWDSHDPVFSIDYGSNGVRDFYRSIATNTLVSTIKADK